MGRLYAYAHHMDVENPMFVPDLSGRLQHHSVECETCGGNGYEEGDEESGESCYDCEGGQQHWPCWYAEDRGRCGTCGADNALVAEIYDRASDYYGAWVCLPCYVRHHKEACGCDLWAWAERKLVLFMPQELKGVQKSRPEE